MAIEVAKAELKNAGCLAYGLYARATPTRTLIGRLKAMAGERSRALADWVPPRAGLHGRCSEQEAAILMAWSGAMAAYAARHDLRRQREDRPA
jgi:hypothetical protein